jgi:hypothetical protein
MCHLAYFAVPCKPNTDTTHLPEIQLTLVKRLITVLVNILINYMPPFATPSPDVPVQLAVNRHERQRRPPSENTNQAGDHVAARHTKTCPSTTTILSAHHPPSPMRAAIRAEPSRPALTRTLSPHAKWLVSTVAKLCLWLRRSAWFDAHFFNIQDVLINDYTISVSRNKMHTQSKANFNSINRATKTWLYCVKLVLLDLYWNIFFNNTNFIPIFFIYLM